MIDVTAEGDLGLSWELEGSHFPHPVTRWTADLYVLTETRAIAQLCERYGMLLDGVAMKEFGGRVYTTVVPLGGKARKPPPAFLMPLLCRVVPPLRRRIVTYRETQRKGALDRVVDRWLSEDEPRLLADLRAELGRDLDRLDDIGLAGALEKALSLAREGTLRHFELHAAGLDAIGRLGLALTRKGWTETDFTGLFTGLSDTSTGPAAAQQRIVDLAGAAGGQAALEEASSLDAIRALSPDVAAALDDYLATWGARAIRYEVADPTIAERPDWVLQVLRDQAGRPADPTLASTQAARREELGARAVRDLGGTDDARRALERARRVFPIREGNSTATVGMPVAALRRVGLVAGDRLVGAGLLDRRDDVFDLEPAEAVSALRGGPDAGTDLAAVARERRRAREAAASADPPPTVGPPASGPPSVTGLPADVAEFVESLLWYTDKIFGRERPDDAGSNDKGSSGLGAAPGVYEGPARIVPDESAFDRIEPGDVLVCPITSPVWSMVFPLVGALVCDEGGVMSHPAIIAREFGIPAVVASGDATSTIPDGALVRVDGTAGTVTLLAPVAA